MEKVKSQIKMIKTVKNYITNFKNNGNDFFYFVTSVNSIGHFSLYEILNFKTNFFLKTKYILKDIFYSSYYFYSNLHYKKKLKKYDKIIVTWAFKGQFNSDGSFYDKTLNYKSSNLKNTLWFVIYLSNDLPKKISNNVVIFRTREKRNRNYLFLLKKIINSFKYIFLSKIYFFNKISNFNIFADVLLNKFRTFVTKKVKYLLIPYEGQPFQNQLFKETKKINPKIKTIGYVHSSPLSMPFNLIKKKTAPDVLIVNGKSQYNFFITFLGWNKKIVKILPSMRFIKEKNNMKKSIYLPLAFKSKDKIILLIKTLLDRTKLNIANFKIKNHPGALNSNSHQDLITRIKRIKQKTKFSKTNSKSSIFIGSSGAIIEALERGNDVFQICENPIFESYSDKLWKGLKKQIITKNIFSYSLKKKNNIIILGKKNYNINKYLRA